MRRAILMLSLFLPSLAMAQAIDTDAYLKNYTGFVKILRSYGVQPTDVDWGDVNSLCLGFLNTEGQLGYNKCRLDKAVLQVAFNEDAVVCDDEGRALYPDVLRKGQTTIIDAGSTSTNVTSILQPTYSRSDIIVSRRSAYDRCMSEKGWRNSRNWRLGMRG